MEEPQRKRGYVRSSRRGSPQDDAATASDESGDYEEKPPPAKRRKVLQSLKKSKVTLKQLEALLKEVEVDKSLFAIPAHEMTEDTFLKRYGLVRHSTAMPSYDRFRSIDTPEETLRCVSALIASDVLYSTEFLPTDPQGEKQFAPIIDRFFKSIGRFTRPHCTEEEEPTFEEVTASAKSGTWEPVKCGLAIDHGEEEVESLPDETLPLSQFSSDDQQELEYATAAAPLQRSDTKLSVYTPKNTVHGLRLKIVVDLKTSPRLRSLFQCGTYAIQTLEETAPRAKDYRPPVYLMGQDTHQWYYGILEIDGYIRVKKGEIDPESLATFPENEEAANPKKFTPSFTRKEVLQMFADWKAEMHKIGAVIPANMYHPVGRMFYRRRQPESHHEVPSMSRQPTLTLGQKRYYDGVLKILVGRRVTKWSVEDATNAWWARHDLAQETLTSSGLPHKYFPSLFIPPAYRQVSLAK